MPKFVGVFFYVQEAVEKLASSEAQWDQSVESVPEGIVTPLVKSLVELQALDSHLVSHLPGGHERNTRARQLCSSISDVIEDGVKKLVKSLQGHLKEKLDQLARLTQDEAVAFETQVDEVLGGTMSEAELYKLTQTQQCRQLNGHWRYMDKLVPVVKHVQTSALSTAFTLAFKDFGMDEKMNTIVLAAKSKVRTHHLLLSCGVSFVAHVCSYLHAACSMHTETCFLHATSVQVAVLLHIV